MGAPRRRQLQEVVLSARNRDSLEDSCGREMSRSLRETVVNLEDGKDSEVARG